MAVQTFNTEEWYDELRRAILEKLRQEIEGKPQHVQQQVTNHRISSLLPNRDIPPRHKKPIEALVFQIFHELYLERIVVPGTSEFFSTSIMEWPIYRITDHGRRVLQTREYSPYDPNGYLDRLKSDITDLDETIVRYVAESLECLQRDCLLAAAVTLGCASEKAMLLLIEQFGQAISDAAKREKYRKATNDWRISIKYKNFRKELDRIAGSLPKELCSPLESHIGGVFNLIRHVRNEAGHPSEEPIERDTIIANQTIFPGYCKHVYSLIDHFAKHGVNF